MSRPRDSVFNGGSDTYRADSRVVCSQDLLDCVRTLDDICIETYDSQQLLRNGTFDLPRMSNILCSQRIFLFVKESTVRQYKSELAEEIEPQILEFLERARKGVKALERRQHALQSKVTSALFKFIYYAEILNSCTKVDQMPTLQAAKNVSTSSKLEEKRHNLLVKQRQRLEEDLRKLQTELDSLVCNRNMKPIELKKIKFHH